jgi:hypothetical protein
MSVVYDTYEGQDKLSFEGEGCLNGNDHLKVFGVDGKIILYWTLNMLEAWTRLV